MSSPQVQVWTPGPVYQNTPAELWMHLQRRDTTFNLVDLKQADLSSITYKVTRGTTLIASGTLTVSSVIYDTLQLGSAWRGDAEGLNFANQFAGTCFPKGNTVYEIEVLFVLTGGQTFPVLVSLPTLPVP